MKNNKPSISVATAVGFVAVLLWALLALFTTASGNVPPFQLTAISFTIASLIGISRWIFNPQAMLALRQPVAVWILGIVGLFGYHAAYFTALKNAPAVEASLIAYLWPLLIVLFSAFLPGERLRWHHILGGIFGLAGASLIVSGEKPVSFTGDFIFGYSMAVVCALIWSSYSVLSRRFTSVPSDIVTGFCIVTALLSALAHYALEQTIWPDSIIEWGAIICLGIGPVGIAFYVWDFGVKHGDIQVLGAASYFSPLLSTLVLIYFGYAQLSWVIALACLLITLGAVVAAKNLIFCSRNKVINP